MPEMLQTQGLSPHQLITPEGRRGLRAGAGGGDREGQSWQPHGGDKGGARDQLGWLAVTGGRWELLGAAGGHEAWAGDTRGGWGTLGAGGSHLGHLGDMRGGWGTQTGSQGHWRIRGDIGGTGRCDSMLRDNSETLGVTLGFWGLWRGHWGTRGVAEGFKGWLRT